MRFRTEARISLSDLQSLNLGDMARKEAIKETMKRDLFTTLEEKGALKFKESTDPTNGDRVYSLEIEVVLPNNTKMEELL